MTCYDQPSPVVYLLSILFKQPQLKTLVQLQFPHVPHLMQMLPRRVQPVQHGGHLGEEALQVCIARPRVLLRKAVAALNPLQQLLSLQIQVTNIVSQMSPPNNTTDPELKCSFDSVCATQLQLCLGYISFGGTTGFFFSF